MLHLGRIREATKLAAGGASDAVIQVDERWASKAFMRHVRANKEDPVRVSEILVGGEGAIDSRGKGQVVSVGGYGE